MKQVETRGRAALMLALCVLAVAAPGCVIVYVNPFAQRKGRFQEIEVEQAEGWLQHKKVLLIDVEGIIFDAEVSSLFFDAESTVAAVKEQLRKAERDPAVRAVVLKINSPGGGVTASDIVYREVIEFKKDTGIPVIACIMDVGASGGYYIAMAADAVVILPTGVTGSIGVIANYMTFDALMKKVGVSSVTIKSGKHKDMGSPFRPINDQEKQILQSVIDDMYGNFLDVVAKGRPQLDKQTIRGLADGRIYTAKQAIDAGLVDKVGYLDDAIDMAKKRAGLRDARVVTYARPNKYRENIYSRASRTGQGGDLNLINVDVAGALKTRQPMFMYLWAPGR